ncbi:MerR family transcriptional regulator [Companilactobacillus kimchiensis]|uniref:Transcriptional regulator n=1 Tax=Companilactobacillus kimchiensis TaxID=993692 RepID=A0A0R2L4R9_9LACO|nr:MerR family transcriptional regulator [Companilactobacillus kimchiensis]KRN96745.1 transcriptional regulator [Companilactobacillus kimchiensis]
MLKISEMAKLANTTRRTLIFYDEEGIFQPKSRSEAGYRYYDYDQLYDLLFILGMKNIGLSLDKIKSLQGKPSIEIMDELIGVQDTIDNKINKLSQIQSAVSRKVSEGEDLQAEPYQPILVKRPKVIFWCSREEASCTDEQIAELFGEFYQRLDKLALMDGNQSGFLTDLPDASSKDYPEASFRIVKESSTNNSGKAMPIIEKASGNYVVVKVDNSTDGVCSGLDAVHDFCLENALEITTDMWQMNTNSALTNRGGSEYLWLEYLVKSA